MSVPIHDPQAPVAGAHPLTGVRALRRLEAALLATLPPFTLMRRAGLAVARQADARLRSMPRATPVAVLCGPGNNGGDGFVAACALARCGHAVHVFVPPELLDAPPRAADAARAWRRWRDASRARQATSLRPLSALDACLPSSPTAWLVIDALLGIGVQRPFRPREDFAFDLDTVHRCSGFTIAVDCPSGLDVDTGSAAGGGRIVQADLTVTMLADKPGLHTGAGRQRAGHVRVDRLRTATEPQPQMQQQMQPQPQPEPADRCGHRIDAGAARSMAPSHAADGNKGTHGHVFIVGGLDGMAGAARLAARAAVGAGAGKVTVAVEATGRQPADPVRPEIMSVAADALRDGLPAGCTVAVVGCGLGTGARARALLRAALDSAQPLVLDADALNLIAGHGAAAAPSARSAVGAAVTDATAGDAAVDTAPFPALAGRRARCVLTPHPLEAARLLGTTVDTVEADRIAAACALAARHRAVVVLKGPGSIVADPDGRWAINDSGNALLATAGTGDVLAGVIGALYAGLIAQQPRGSTPEPSLAARAACCGVWMHGFSAERIAQSLAASVADAGSATAARGTSATAADTASATAARGTYGAIASASITSGAPAAAGIAASGAGVEAAAFAHALPLVWAWWAAQHARPAALSRRAARRPDAARARSAAPAPDRA